MIKRLALMLVFSISLERSYCQENKTNLDFIIVVDGEIAVGAISSMKIEFEDHGVKKMVTPNYYPGHLSFDSITFALMKSDSSLNLCLKFAFQEWVGQRQIYHDYEIKLEKEWLEDYFNILYIYNTENPKYRRRFKPISPGRNYTYELRSPSHTSLRVQEK